MTTIGIAIGTMNATLAIASYFELIDTVSSDVSKLLHQSFTSARMNLELAQTADDQVQRNEYLKEARSKFIEAVAVEKDENLVSAYAGLALCQYLLMEKTNAQLTIEKLLGVELSLSSKIKGAIAVELPPPIIIDPAPPSTNVVSISYKNVLARKRAFEEYKENVVKEFELSLNE
jgi:predicted YcjX-like family ATPase